MNEIDILTLMLENQNTIIENLTIIKWFIEFIGYVLFYNLVSEIFKTRRYRRKLR